jgi:hypothetical protein
MMEIGAKSGRPRPPEAILDCDITTRRIYER